MEIGVDEGCELPGGACRGGAFVAGAQAGLRIEDSSQTMVAVGAPRVLGERSVRDRGSDGAVEAGEVGAVRGNGGDVLVVARVELPDEVGGIDGGDGGDVDDTADVDGAGGLVGTVVRPVDEPGSEPGPVEWTVGSTIARSVSTSQR
jgi:hypothetical protein